MMLDFMTVIYKRIAGEIYLKYTNSRGFVTLELFIDFCKEFSILGNLCSKGLIAKIYGLEAEV